MRKFIGAGTDSNVWFIGVVEDRNDPAELGRVRVRCYGWHTEDKGEIPTASLPWAIVLNGTNSASMSGVGETLHGLIEGSWVFGFFIDGQRAQEPLIIGSIPGAPSQLADTELGFNDPTGDFPRYIDEPDINKLSRGVNTKTHQTDTVSGEPDEPYGAKYPFNKVYETESGHFKEWDDTPSAERVREGHRSGTQYEIHPNGDRVVRVVGDGYEIVAGRKQVHIGGSCKLVVDGALDISVGAECRIQSGGTMTFKAPKIDLNPPGTGYSKGDSVYVDPPVPYEKNIVEVKTTEVPNNHPDNAEQVEQVTNPQTGKKEEPIYQEKSTSNCGGLTQVNPWDIAYANYLEGGWAETGDNPKIAALWDEIGYNGSQYADETAWCAGFVGATLKRSGNKYIQTMSSRAYANYGKEVSLSEVKKGDIVVFYRRGRNSGLGHVGFATGDQNATSIEILGGNQRNNLNVTSFSKENASKGWGILTIRRAVSCEDGITTPPTATADDLLATAFDGSVT